MYIMGSVSGTLYIGFTGNLHQRVFQHKFHQMEGFTNRYDVERLLYWASYDEVHKAIGREKQLKGWSRAKKIALIEWRNPHWLDLAKGRDASTPLSMTTRGYRWLEEAPPQYAASGLRVTPLCDEHLPCHAERSASIRLANGHAQSKHPYPHFNSSPLGASIPSFS